MVPWEGRPERLDVFLLGVIMFSGIYNLVLLPATPSLVGTHPVLLELILHPRVNARVAPNARAHRWLASDLRQSRYGEDRPVYQPGRRQRIRITGGGLTHRGVPDRPGRHGLFCCPCPRQ